MNTGVWIGDDRDGLRILRVYDGGATLDRPAMLDYRRPVDSAAADVGGMAEVIDVREAALERWAGWYEGAGKRVLLTHVPDPDLGEPLAIVSDGDALIRLYPVATDRLIAADARVVRLVRLDAGQRAVEIGGMTLVRADAWPERNTEFVTGGVRLAGTFIAPGSGGPYPAAVLVHGAGYGQRDVMRMFAESLLDAGIAALIYDKRGYGESGGSRGPTIFDQADAAAAGLDWLRAQPEVDARLAGLVGFSNGMWSVPIVAAGRSDVAFLGGIGSAGVTMAESEVHRRAKVLREAGVGEQDVELASQAWRRIFAIAAAGRADPGDAASLSRLTEAVAAAVGLAEIEVPEYASQNPMLSPVPPQIAADDLVGMVGGVGDPELDHDPAADYAKVRCPVVLIWGEHDTSIPVNVSRRRIGEALDKAGNGQVRLVVLPGLDHLLNVPRGDVVGISPEEAMNLLAGFRFGPGARGLLGRSLAGLLQR